MATFGIATIVGWDLDALAALGTDLSTHSEDLRGCFADFRGSTDLAGAWGGGAADAAHQHAQDLATDIYDLSDMIGLMAAQLGRRHSDLVEARDAVIRTRNVAQDNGFVVHDDGTVAVGPAAPGEPHDAADTSEKLTEAAQYSAILHTAIGDAAAADIDLARALRDAQDTVQTHAQDPGTVAAAVSYDPAHASPDNPLEDPFLSDVHLVGPVVPHPGDPGFALYWDALTPEERALAAQQWGGLPDDFDPFEGVKDGELPSWASAYNFAHGGGTTTDSHGNEVIGKGYGYLGGGTILGPGGKQWPIVSPYYSDGKHVYLQDSGAPRADGGIDDLDGRDPGWHTVETYRGPGGFGQLTDSTRSIIIGENLGGQDLEVNPVDSKDITIGSDGQPVFGGEEHHAAEPPSDKPYWDVAKNEGEERGEPFNEEEADKGVAALGVQAGQGAAAAQEAGEHDHREYDVSYQVNDDGRVRAVVNTYTSGPNEDGGGTNVGGFNTSFPGGQHGSASEVPIDVRHATGPFTPPVSGDPEVHYLGDPARGGELLENTEVLHEKLDR